MMQAASKSLKPIRSERGGRTTNTVCDDVTIDSAVKGSMFGIYFGEGQVCASGSRLYVQESIYEQFMEAFIDKAQKIKVGNPLHPTTHMGPQVSEQQLERIEHFVKTGEDQGAKLVIGGERAKVDNGNFFTPTVFENVSSDMTIAKEEIFGPVLSVIKFKDEEDALQKANDTLY